MKQLNLFENNKDDFLQEAEEFLAEIEFELEKIEAQERFFEEAQAFEWAEEFPKLCDENGKFQGFDLVVGNPPYISSKEIVNKKGLENYDTAVKQFDLFSLFIERALQITKENGYNSMIIPDSFLGRDSFAPIREFIYKNANLFHIVQLDNVFEKANVSSCIYLLQKNKTKSKIEFWKTTQHKIDKNNVKIKYINFLTDKTLNSYRLIFANEKELKIIKKGFLYIPLSEITISWRGEEIGKKATVLHDKKRKNDLQILSGENLQKYNTKGNIKYIAKNDIKKNIENYLQEKIIVRQLGSNITATISNLTTLQSVYCINSQNKKYNNKYILGILNSNYINYIYQNYIAEKQTFPRILLHNIRKLTIPEITEKNKAIANKIEKLVNEILTIKKADNQADISAQQTEIDKLVYKLYDLIQEEFEMIEKN